MTHIVKRKGHRQEYDERKVYASVFASCLNVHMGDKEAESIAEKVTKDINSWINGKDKVDYRDIFGQVKKSLGNYDKDAAFMYETHRDVS